MMIVDGTVVISVAIAILIADIIKIVVAKYYNGQ